MFNTHQRTFTIPPASDDEIREWLKMLRPGHHVIIRHGNLSVGHAVLVPADTNVLELAILAYQAYQHAHVGGWLLKTLLQAANDIGTSEICLEVERTNRPAIVLYQNLGFSTEQTGVGDTVKATLSRD